MLRDARGGFPVSGERWIAYVRYTTTETQAGKKGWHGTVKRKWLEKSKSSYA